MADAMRRAPQVLKYAAIAVVVLLVVALVYLATGGGTKTGTAYFKTANSINPGDNIAILGMSVGKVDKLTPEGEKVRVDFHYDSKWKLPADVKAAILSPTLVATRFIQLDPAYTSGPEFENGGVIPVERTAVPLEFDELKKQLELISDDFGPNGMNKDGAINRALTVINKNGMQDGVGQGQPFHEMITELSKAAKTLADGRGDLFGTVDNLAHFSSVLNQYDKQIVEFQGNLGDVAKILDDNSQELDQLLPRIEDAGKQVDKFLDHHSGQLTETIDRAGSITRNIAKVRDSLAQGLHQGPNTLTNFTNLFHPRTGELYGALSVAGYGNSFASPGNSACALITAPAYANELTAQQQCVKMLGPLFNQLAPLVQAGATALLPTFPLGPPGVVVPQGSTPSYGDMDQRKGQGQADASPNQSNADVMLGGGGRSQTAPGGDDRSFTDGGFPGIPVPMPPTGNPKIPFGGN
jgi:phospholipid/cholesterol/gamma-HCH transport system substrate-binding protein